MSKFSKFLYLDSGVARTVDLSLNTIESAGLSLKGSTSGSVLHKAAAATTDYTIIWPAAQGSAGSYLTNDGSGQLAWSQLTSAPAISNTLIAGQSFSANTSYVVRWGMNALGEDPNRVYAADYDATSYDEFWAFGIAFSPVGVAAGENIHVYSFGVYSLASADVPFSSSDVGSPVWLGAAGAITTTAPAGDTLADLKIGIVMSSGQIWIDGQMMGVGGSSAPGGGGGGGGSVSFPITIAEGGTGQTTRQDAINALAGAQTAGYFLRGDGTNVSMSAIQASDVPTLNQNTTGTAANITASSNSTLTSLPNLSLPGSQVSGDISGNAENVNGVVAIANGGTGQSTRQAAINALVSIQTAGYFLRGDGTNATMSAIQASDVPTLPVNKLQAFSSHSRVLVSDSSGYISESSVTATTLGYLDATSSIQGQLDSKVDSSSVGVAGGVASLDGTGKVPSAQLPSYVDDVVEYANLAAFPGTGETGKIYVALDTNKCYRWSGSTYVEVSPSEVNSVNGSTGIVTVDAINELTGDVTAGPASGSQSKVATLATVNSNVGTYGDASHVAAVTVDAKGRVTGVTAIAIAISGSAVSGNISGNAANVTGTVAIANGGTGQTTRQAAIDALAGAQTAGYFLRGDGTHISMSAIQVSDVPTLNQNTTGTAANITATSNSTLTTLSSLSLPGSQVTGNISGNAANVTGTVAIANGGTGQTTRQAAMDALAGTQSAGTYLRSDGTHTTLSAIQASDVPTLNQNTTGTAANITASSNSTLTSLPNLSLPGSQVSGNISGNAANVTGTVAIANGGTGQTTAAGALVALAGSLYDQELTVVASGATGNQINGPVSSGTAVTLPNSGSFAGAELEVYLNGQLLFMGSSRDWQASGAGPTYTALTFGDNLQVGDTIHFRKVRNA